MIDLQLLSDSFPLLLRGASVSLLIAFSGSLIGALLGTLLGYGQTRAQGWKSWPITAYVTLFRGTPMLVQIFFVFYVLPQAGINLSAFWAATSAIGLNSAAYISQTVRAGINAVDGGQLEAAKTLGMSRGQITRYIILPQALKVILPALGNEFVTLIKDSSLASVIGVVELSKEASLIRSRTYDAFTALAGAALIYLAMTSFLSYLIHKWERRLDYRA